MAGRGDGSGYVLKELLIPEQVAHALTPTLVEIRNRWGDLECSGSRAGRSAHRAELQLRVATRLLLVDLDDIISLGKDRGRQVSAARWESLLHDLQGLKRKLQTPR